MELGHATALADISNSPAYAILDQLEQLGKLSTAQVNLYKSKYAQLHEIVLGTYENEKELLVKARQLNNELVDKKGKLERKSTDSVEFADKIQDITDQLDQLNIDVASMEEQNGMCYLELFELKRTKEELTDELETRRRQSEVLIAPVVEKLNASVREHQEEIHSNEELNLKELANKESYTRRISTLKAENEVLEKLKIATRVELNRAKINPERIKSQIEISSKAINGLAKQSDYLSAEIDKLNEEFEAIGVDKKKVSAAQLEWMFNLEKIRKEIWKSERTVTEIAKLLENEKVMHQNNLERRLELEAEFQRDRLLARSAQINMQKLGKSVDELKRRFEKLKRKRNACVIAMVPLQENWESQGHELDIIQSQTKTNRAAVVELQADVDILISQFLREEKTDKLAEGRLQQYMTINRHLEEAIDLSMRKERELKGIIRDMSSKRDAIARESSKASADYRATREELKVKDLIMIDLNKKVQDVKNRLSQCSSMYDLIKNQRNKYANLTQSSSQELAEMKEKIKILQNEVEILRSESVAKEKSLTDEAKVLQTAQTARDALRVEQSRLQFKNASERTEYKRQLNEVQKLHATITSAEKEMIRLRKDYSKAVEDRNASGIQLIDRNDELCILHEKCHIFEGILRNGEQKLAEYDDKIQSSKARIGEIHLKIQTIRQHTPSAHELRQLEARLADLTQQLNHQREQIEKYSERLETPSADGRQKRLKGTDLEMHQLSSKIEILQDVLNDKKEQLLEKDLVLEEVGTLSDRLRCEAAEGHDHTFIVANKMNQCQAKIRMLTRKMMATVSELSMYQATAIKLEQEKREKEGELIEAKSLLSQGLAPSESAEHEWYRMERERLRRHEELTTYKAQNDSPSSFAGEKTGGSVRTTAEARPNAYVPDELGIPKPYGGNAPFKPSVLGANMRHIQKPKIKEVII